LGDEFRVTHHLPTLGDVTGQPVDHDWFLADPNARQSIGAMHPVDAHRPRVVNLSEVLSLKEKRTVSNDGL
jgi:hypothetical protein